MRSCEKLSCWGDVLPSSVQDSEELLYSSYFISFIFYKWNSMRWFTNTENLTINWRITVFLPFSHQQRHPVDFKLRRISDDTRKVKFSRWSFIETLTPIFILFCMHLILIMVTMFEMRHNPQNVEIVSL